MSRDFQPTVSSRSPYGERGLKYGAPSRPIEKPSGRSPYGERGLKSDDVRQTVRVHGSLFLRRAWIEMLSDMETSIGLSSLSLRRAWIEIRTPSSLTAPPMSLSLRRAWIEISGMRFNAAESWGRSPYGERGLKYRHAIIRLPRGRVAFLTESVD